MIPIRAALSGFLANRRERRRAYFVKETRRALDEHGAKSPAVRKAEADDRLREHLDRPVVPRLREGEPLAGNRVWT